MAGSTRPVPKEVSVRDLQLPGRSVVHALNGMAATSHPLSTLAAVDVLRAGGNAVDAAVAACAVQCVVEPMSTGIGGDCFVLYAPGGGPEVHGLNGSGWAPAGLSDEGLLAEGIDRVEMTSPHAVTVPGAVDAWEALLGRFGTKGLDELLRPAIGYAEDGWAVTPRIAVDWQRQTPKLQAEASSRRHYLKADGTPPRAGERFAVPALGRALREIAAKGRAGFYEGWVAEDIVRYLAGKGGKHAAADFAEQRAEWVTPIGTAYRGYEMRQIPPNGQGITALVLLNILSGYDLAAMDPRGSLRLHLEAEAARLAFAARDEHVADQRFADVPVETLLSAAFAAAERAKIDPARAMPLPGGTGPVYRDTIYLTVVDRDRNCCSFINSLYFPFGSGLTAPESGVCLQNRGSGFRVQPGHPNTVRPRKRPMHTIIPGMCLKDGKVAYSYGVMGGGYQPVGHAHVLSNLIDYGMDPQEALDCARVFHVAGKLDVERGIPDATMQELAAKGHVVQRPEMPWGGAQLIALDWRNGTLAGASDPRKDGMALGY